MAVTTYVAFRSSEALHTTTDGFITRMNNGATRTEPETMDKIMRLFIQEALQAFLLNPTEQAGLSNTLKKIISLTADTISKASHVVIKSTVKKLNLSQNQKTAEYMDSIRIQLEDAGELAWHVAFPISDEMASKGRHAMAQIIDGQEDAAREDVKAFFHELTDIAMLWYFERPMDLLGLGPIMRKVANMGIATTRKAMHSAIDRVIPKLHGEEFRISVQYSMDMMIDGPSR